VTDGTSAQGFTLGGLTSDATSVNASTFIGNLTFTAAARAGTTAMTITGGTGTDALNMKNANDVIDGGTGTDTLSIAQNAVLGGFLIDLSSTVDQVTTYNGSANSAVQKGFERVNLSAITGNFGADVTGTTGINTIVGTSNNDVINGNTGQDTITGGAGNDSINITDSGVAATNSATLVFNARGTNGDDTITGFLTGATTAGGDVLDLSAVLTLDNIANQGQITGGTFNVIAAGSAAAVAFDSGDIVVLSGNTAAVGTAALVAAEFAAGEAFAAVSNGDAFIIIVSDTTTGNTMIYSAVETANTTLTAGELTLIGTLTGFSATNADALVLTSVSSPKQ